MLNSTQSIIKHKTGLLNLAEELGNVSKACQVMGLSRDTFYCYKAAVEEGGVEALFDRNRRKPNLANRVDEATEQAVTRFALDFPAYGQARTSNEHASWACLSHHQACARSGCAMIWPISGLG